MMRPEHLAILETIAEDPHAPCAERLRAIQMCEQADPRTRVTDCEFYDYLDTLTDAQLEQELAAFDIPTASEQSAVDREVDRIKSDPKLLECAIEREAVRLARMPDGTSSPRAPETP